MKNSPLKYNGEISSEIGDNNAASPRGTNAQPIPCNKTRIEVCKNSLHLRWGMEIRINDQRPASTGPDTPVVIESITYSGTPGDITANIQLSHNIDDDLSVGSAVTFHGDRNLNFHPDRKITGLNVIDGMIYWTDNHSEPKKVNIERGKEGSKSWKYGAGWDGSLASIDPYTWPGCQGSEDIACYSDFDQHTKLIVEGEHIMDCENSTSTCYIYGCTDMTATNYNPQANYDDGSCIIPTPVVYGCDDGTFGVNNAGACNIGMTYWSQAATGNPDGDYNANDTNLCVFPDDCEICDGSGGVMFDPNCSSCNDSNATNYSGQQEDCSGNINGVDLSCCRYCTNPISSNYYAAGQYDCNGDDVNDPNYTQGVGWDDCCDSAPGGTCVDLSSGNYGGLGGQIDQNQENCNEHLTASAHIARMEANGPKIVEVRLNVQREDNVVPSPGKEYVVRYVKDITGDGYNYNYAPVFYSDSFGNATAGGQDPMDGDYPEYDLRAQPIYHPNGLSFSDQVNAQGGDATASRLNATYGSGSHDDMITNYKEMWGWGEFPYSSTIFPRRAELGYPPTGTGIRLSYISWDQVRDPAHTDQSIYNETFDIHNAYSLNKYKRVGGQANGNCDPNNPNRPGCCDDPRQYAGVPSYLGNVPSNSQASSVTCWSLAENDGKPYDQIPPVATLRTYEIALQAGRRGRGPLGEPKQDLATNTFNGGMTRQDPFDVYQIKVWVPGLSQMKNQGEYLEVSSETGINVSHSSFNLPDVYIMQGGSSGGNKINHMNRECQYDNNNPASSQQGNNTPAQQKACEGCVSGTVPKIDASGSYLSSLNPVPQFPAINHTGITWGFGSGQVQYTYDGVSHYGANWDFTTKDPTANPPTFATPDNFSFTGSAGLRGPNFGPNTQKFDGFPTPVRPNPQPLTSPQGAVNRLQFVTPADFDIFNPNHPAFPGPISYKGDLASNDGGYPAGGAYQFTENWHWDDFGGDPTKARYLWEAYHLARGDKNACIHGLGSMQAGNTIFGCGSCPQPMNTSHGFVAITIGGDDIQNTIQPFESYADVVAKITDPDTNETGNYYPMMGMSRVIINRDCCPFNDSNNLHWNTTGWLDPNSVFYQGPSYTGPVASGGETCC